MFHFFCDVDNPWHMCAVYLNKLNSVSRLSETPKQLLLEILWLINVVKIIELELGNCWSAVVLIEKKRKKMSILSFMLLADPYMIPDRPKHIEIEEKNNCFWRINVINESLTVWFSPTEWPFRYVLFFRIILSDDLVLIHGIDLTQKTHTSFINVGSL